MQATSPLAFDELPRGAGGTGATDQINEALDAAGIDVPASLYDEALTFAREGRLAPAAERLRMLLVLDSTDANAALLLGKVQASRGQWQEALTHLDNAAGQGALLPPGLREEVEVNLRKQIQDAEQHRKRVAAREQAEIRGLRQEAKRLRSDNAALELQIEELNRRVKLWSSITALVAGSASALLIAAMVFGGPKADDGAAVAVADADGVVTEEVVTGAAPAVADASGPAVEEVVIGGGASVEAPAAAAPVAAPDAGPKGIALPTTHVVKKGEILGSIAKKYYGKSSEWKRILDANDAVLHGSVKKLRPGMELNIPAL